MSKRVSIWGMIWGRPWRIGLFGLILIYGIVILATFTDYGITADERSRAIYGYSVFRWYASLFQEYGIFTWSNAWLYGGFYETVVYLLLYISPLELADTRHLCNALVGLMGVGVAFGVGRFLGGDRAGFLAALCLILTPRYYGHAFNNPKDLPFAVFYLWSLYELIRGLDALPNLPWRRVWMTGVVIGLTMGIRVGGVILLGYVGLFYGVRYVQVLQQGGWAPKRAVGRYVYQVGLIFVISYATMLVFWPWAQTNPLVHPFKALTVFARFPEEHVSFFEGHYFKAREIPWHYAPKWLLLTLPEFVFAGLLVGIGLVYRKAFELEILKIAVLVFGAVFPLAYLVLAGAPLYNGARHFLFVVPPLVVLSAVGFEAGVRHLQGRWCWGLWLVVGGLLSYTHKSDTLKLIKGCG